MINKAPRTKIARAVVDLLERHPRAQVMKAVARLLIAQRRVNEIDLLLSDIARQLMIQKQHVVAHVTTAQALTTTLRHDIEKYIKAGQVTKTVEVMDEIDPSLLTGVRITTPTSTTEWSARQQLEHLRTH